MFLLLAEHELRWHGRVRALALLYIRFTARGGLSSAGISYCATVRCSISSPIDAQCLLKSGCFPSLWYNKSVSARDPALTPTKESKRPDADNVAYHDDGIPAGAPGIAVAEAPPR